MENMTPLLALAGTALTVIGGVIGAIIAATMPKRGSAENALIDQLQEELGRRDKRLDALEERQDATDEQLRLRDLFIQALIDHIYRGKPPPPPERPAGMR